MKYKRTGSRILLTFLSFIFLTLPLSNQAQTINADNIQYKGGAKVTEKSGNGAPSGSCIGLTRYTQLDNQPFPLTWLCINGAYVQEFTLPLGNAGQLLYYSANNVVSPISTNSIAWDQITANAGTFQGTSVSGELSLSHPNVRLLVGNSGGANNGRIVLEDNTSTVGEIDVRNGSFYFYGLTQNQTRPGIMSITPTVMTLLQNQNIVTNGSGSFSSVSLATDPSTALQAATKQYVDNHTGSATPTGPASGDLGSTFPGPIVVGLQGHSVQNISPVNEAVLIWNSTTSSYNVRTLTLDDLQPGFSINSFTGGQTIEIGTVITNPVFNASYSSIPTSANITNSDNINSPLTLTTPFTNASIVGTFVKTTTATTNFVLTAISTSTKTASQSFAWEPLSFAGVGAASATGTVTSSGTSALLSTGDVLGNVGLSTTNVGHTYGPFNPSGQKIYLLIIGTGHTFKDASTGFSFAFNTPTAVSFINEKGSSVAMQLYESTNTLNVTSGSFNILVSN